MKSSSNDHRTRVTKMLIRKAFTDLLSQKPIQSISVKELCEQAGVNRGTFYAHYEDIYKLLSQIEADMLEDFSTALEPIFLSAAGGDHFLVEICTGIFQCLKNNSDLCVVMLGDYSDKSFVDKLLALGKETCLRTYSQHFRDADHRQMEYFYAFASAGCIGLVRQWAMEGMNTPASEIAQAAEEFLLNGIGVFRQKAAGRQSGIGALNY